MHFLVEFGLEKSAAFALCRPQIAGAYFVTLFKLA